MLRNYMVAEVTRICKRPRKTIYPGVMKAIPRDYQAEGRVSDSGEGGFAGD
ncbi:MAG: hypothetical protein HY954_11955 [Deltaproteobacteria bacterium]|nr:hypothetical protein [Deltaproteobacteria bacterium]